MIWESQVWVLLKLSLEYLNIFLNKCIFPLSFIAAIHNKNVKQ